MQYRIGDLVREKSNVVSLGVIIGVGKANSSTLNASKHSSMLVDLSQDIYYVFFPNYSDVSFPYYAGELMLESEAS